MSEPRELIQLDDPNNQRSVVVDDEGRTIYAYLYLNRHIRSAVWLKNLVDGDSSWSRQEDMPFSNRPEYIAEEAHSSFSLDAGPLAADWDTSGVNISQGDRRIARLEEADDVGWSSSRRLTVHS